MTGLSIVVTGVLALVFSIYMLSGKDRLLAQCRRVLRAYTPPKVCRMVLEVTALTAGTFSKFVTGQITEACILGGLTFLGMVLLRLDYPLLIAVLIGVSALVPIVGAYVGAFTSALLLAMMRLSKIKPIKWFAGAYIAVFRSTPMLVQLSIIYFGLFHYISLPRTLLFGFIAINRFIPGVVALALNSSAYVAEIFRAGILAVDKGQTEAARSLGLSSWQSMRLVVLPQAIKNVLPALANEVVTMVKESSICSVLGMAEIMYTAQTVSGNSYITLAPYVLAALVYFCINYPASKAIEAIERRMRRGDKQ